MLENIYYSLLPFFSTNATLAELLSTTAHKQLKEYKDYFEALLKTKYGSVKDIRHPFDSCGSKGKGAADQVHIGYLNMADLYRDMH